jgi:hypothetical protein
MTEERSALESPASSSGNPILGANEFIEDELRRRLRQIEEDRNAHALCFSGPIYSPADNFVRDLLEAHQDNSTGDQKSDSLVVILTTPGGQVEPVQRIVETIRHYYSHVSFIVPDYAYSAGTILCMSGDEIFMDYFSRLGPIDPQLPRRNGPSIPALGYLRQYEALLKKEIDGELTMAELQVMLNFDQAELYMYDQAEKQSIALLEDWLVRYKFKNWSVTRTRGQEVNEEMKVDRAHEIGKTLNDTDVWHSHGHGISMEVLNSDRINLMIDDLADHPSLHSKVKEYDRLLIDYMGRMGASLAVQMTSSPLLIAK